MRLTYGGAIGYIYMSLSGSGNWQYGRMVQYLLVPISLKGYNKYSPTAPPWGKDRAQIPCQPEGLGQIIFEFFAIKGIYYLKTCHLLSLVIFVIFGKERRTMLWLVSSFGLRFWFSASALSSPYPRIRIGRITLGGFLTSGERNGGKNKGKGRLFHPFMFLA